MTRLSITGLLFITIVSISAIPTRAQADDICREFGVMPSLDMPWQQIPYVFGTVTLVGFDPALKRKVTVIFADRDNPSKKITLSKSGNYCFKRTGTTSGSLAIEVDGVEVARRTLASFGGAQQREDFDVYPDKSQDIPPPGSVSAKFIHPKNEKTVDLYQKAAKAEREKDTPAAIGFVKEIVARDPADFIAWGILGSLYLEQKSFDESDAAFRKCLALKIEYTPAWINVGRLRSAQKQYEAAIEIFKHAATLEPTSARIYRLLGEAYLNSKQGTLGVDALNKALALDPVGMADCHLLIGRLYDLAGAKQLAAKEYKAYLTKVPDYVEKKKLEKYISDNL